MAFQMKSLLNDEKMSGSIDTELKENLNKEVSEIVSWLEQHTDEPKEVYENKKIEFQEKMKPLLQGTTPPGMENTETTSNNDGPSGPSGPNIEDVD